ncbi:hypothetical protein GFL85_18595 [Rhizobium laguerreae]|uniref:hypothetical protein n=1 Tax=Rhizobium laguerreae TaxID=1076926 RepID=UPI00143F3978|nr:hypothetical protein [Rhizobium laguerreae]NKM13015.1 hypothetical protein [Rhizobium laguerreae]
MPVEYNTHKKLDALILQIDRLLLSDFPHEDTSAALNLMREYFIDQKARLTKSIALADPKIISQACVTINERIYSYLPLLGFLLRSTNVRNSFESYDAFVQIAHGLIGDHAKVVMSSEWDFSPLTYPMTVSVLPNFVLLGMPTPESANALILPLAGHELGHSVWVSEDLEASYSTQLEDQAREYLKKNWSDFKRAFPEHGHLQPTDEELSNNIFLAHLTADIVNLASSQVEETFCDAIGVAVFGKSYIHSFHYLLAPGLGGGRSPHYPPIRSRATFMKDYGGMDLLSLGYSDYAKEFDDDGSISLPPRDAFLLKSADAISHDQASLIYQEAKAFALSKIPQHLPTEEGELEVYKMYKSNIPARAPRSLADILNAGWAYVINEGPQFDETHRPLFNWISELMLKSIEVLEFRRRLADAGL